MQLNLKTKVVRFELVDDEQETTITLSSDDDQETICRKLRRALSLAEPPRATALGAADKIVEAARQQAARPGLEMPRAVPAGNGWAKYAKPEVPEHLKGEVEMIGEDEAP